MFASRTSYQVFLDARRRGEIPARVRFQVSLPTLMAVINSFCIPDDAQKILPAYEQAMLAEVSRICDAIPHEDLAIQWDVCIEMVIWDGRWPRAQPFPGMDHVFGATFARLADAVPEDVELGFHLCYGDLDAEHFVQPIDATKMVELANLIASGVQRPIHWMHMPVHQTQRHQRDAGLVSSTTPFTRPCAICTCIPRQNCSSAWFTCGTEWRERVAA